MKYREALAWLYATQKFGIKLGLESTQRLLAALGIERASSSRIIHVAGTNGKGSVCAMIDSICRAAGFRTGLFTSPHLISFRERIRASPLSPRAERSGVEGSRYASEMISEDEVARGLTQIRDLVTSWDPHPTFFEITTALALQHFQDTRCEVIVLETGMGGRLDATNAVTADVSVITPIDLDHQKWLGHSIAEIAAEKAGIIKPNVPVISARQQTDAAGVIKKRVQECGSLLQIVDNTWRDSPIGLRGSHQAENAALAVAAAENLELPISKDAVAHGLQSVEWPARFQTWNERIVIDGAHNPAGARALVQTWREEFGDERPVVILAVLRDKNTAAIAKVLTPIASEFILPQIRSERAVPAAGLAALLSLIAPLLHHSVIASVPEALSLAQRQSLRVLITGSLHFAGEALAVLNGAPDALEDCAQ